MGAARCLSCIFVSQNARAAPCRLVTRRRGVPPRSAPRSRRAFLPDGRLRRAALRSRGRARRGSRCRNSIRLSRSARVSLRGRLDRAVLLLRRRGVLAHAVGARVAQPDPLPTLVRPERARARRRGRVPGRALRPGARSPLRRRPGLRLCALGARAARSGDDSVGGAAWPESQRQPP